MALFTLAWALLASAAPASPVQLPHPQLVHHKRDARPLPDYAKTYAPVFYLHSTEQWWPSDVATHLQHVVPEIDGAPVAGFATPGSVTLANLGTVDGSAFLTSADNVDDGPAWQTSGYGRPSDATGGRSAAPATIIAVEKNATWTDVFYFAFYSYNDGGRVLGLQFNDHVGDWEHVMVRFVDGRPTGMYFSQHGAGSAYAWAAVNTTSTGRPRAFIAAGGHAIYAKAGRQPYTIAGSLLTDKTDTGFAWDVVQNYRGFWFDNATGTFSDEAGDDAAWLQWPGRWGDDQYPSSRTGQYCIFGQCRYTAGPTGPVAKNLGRVALCQREDCTVFTDNDDLTHQSKRTVYRQ